MKLHGRIPGRPGTWEIAIENDTIAHVRPRPDGDAAGDGRADAETIPWISSGWLDIQINGYAGHVLNEAELSPSTIEGTVRALWPTGTALAFLTLTTGSAERLLASARTLGAYLRDGDADVRASIAGVHLEGPYIAAEDGPRGAHGLQHVRAPSWEEFERLQDALGGALRLVTVAPEAPGAIPFIERAAASGVLVALGHTNASQEDVWRAVGAGARMSTHLGNGAHSRIKRHPNYIWEQLGCDALAASFIPDGHHLPPTVLKSMLRAKGVERSVLTTDASGVAGMPPGVYHIQERDVEVRAGGPVLLSGTEYLAGSALRLEDGLANAVRFAGVSLLEALNMVTVNPARLTGLENRTGELRAGQEANLTVFRTTATGDLQVERTIVSGRVVHEADVRTVGVQA